MVPENGPRRYPSRTTVSIHLHVTVSSFHVSLFAPLLLRWFNNATRTVAFRRKIYPCRRSANGSGYNFLCKAGARVLHEIARIVNVMRLFRSISESDDRDGSTEVWYVERGWKRVPDL